MQVLRKGFIALLTFLALTGSSWSANALNEPYTPTRAEWLTYSLLTALNEQSSTWGRRIHPMVTIGASGESVVITLVLALQERPLSKSSTNEYIQRATSVAKEVLNSHPWSKGLPLTVQLVE